MHSCQLLGFLNTSIIVLIKQISAIEKDNPVLTLVLIICSSCVILGIINVKMIVCLANQNIVNFYTSYCNESRDILTPKSAVFNIMITLRKKKFLFLM